MYYVVNMFHLVQSKTFFIMLNFNNIVVLIVGRGCTKIWATKYEDMYAYDKIISCSTDVSDELQYVLLHKYKHLKTCMKVSNVQKTMSVWCCLATYDRYNNFWSLLDVDENAQFETYVQYQSKINTYLQELFLQAVWMIFA